MRFKELSIELSKLCKYHSDGHCKYVKCTWMTSEGFVQNIDFECNPTKCTALWYKIKENLVKKELYEDYDES